jgi:hypothetical protein
MTFTLTFDVTHDTPARVSRPAVRADLGIQ